MQAEISSGVSSPEDSSRSGSCARSRITCKFSHVAVGQGRGEYAVDKKGDSVDGKRKSDICRPIGGRYWTCVGDVERGCRCRVEGHGLDDPEG